MAQEADKSLIPNTASIEYVTAHPKHISVRTADALLELRREYYKQHLTRYASSPYLDYFLSGLDVSWTDPNAAVGGRHFSGQRSNRPRVTIAYKGSEDNPVAILYTANNASGPRRLPGPLGDTVINSFLAPPVARAVSEAKLHMPFEALERRKYLWIREAAHDAEYPILACLGYLAAKPVEPYRFITAYPWLEMPDFKAELARWGMQSDGSREPLVDNMAYGFMTETVQERWFGQVAQVRDTIEKIPGMAKHLVHALTHHEIRS